MSSYWKKKLEELEQEKKAPSVSYWDKKTAELENEKKTVVTVSSKKDDDDDIAPIKSSKDDGKLDFFQKGAFEDGYQVGDITKTILGSTGDAGLNIVKGVAGLGEGVGDLINYGIAAAADAIGKDDFADRRRKNAQANAVDNLMKPAEDYLDKYSVLGRTSDAILQGVGQVGAVMATGGIAGAAGLGAAGATAVTTGLMGLSGAGSGMSEAYQSGANDLQALKHGLNSGAADAISELIFGGLGKGINALGFSKGLSSADDILAKLVGSKFKHQAAKNIVEFGIKSGAEGLEEVIAGVAQAYSKYNTYLKDQGIEFSDVLKDENLLEQFVVGSFTSGLAQISGLHIANKTGTDFITGLNQNEQAVVKKEIENRIAEAEADGTKLTAKEKAAIEAQVEKDLEKGYISTDLIDEVVGGETYKAYKDSVDQEDALFNEFEELGKATNPTLAQQYRYRELDSRVKSIKDNDLRSRRKEQLDQFVSEQVKGSRLAESYNEVARRGQKFEADLTKYDQKQQATIQKAIDSGFMNNSNRTHEFVDFVAKIAADTGTAFEFSNKEKLMESGFALKDGKLPNGFKTKDGITLNMSSNASRRFVVGHEITHVLEGTELYRKLQEAVFDYAKAKGEYDSRLESITALYKKYAPDADPLQELTADLVGEYIFSDQDFVNNLSVKNQNVFQKVYGEIKHLLKLATAGSQEARMLEKAKRAFEKAYREGETARESEEISDSKTKYSIREEAPPKNTGVAYKVFFVKDGKLYPPMVANPDGADTPMGVWLNADMGTAAPPSKTGRAQVKAGGKGTQGGSGSLAFRPGWHLGDLPRASQFDRVNPETGKKELFPENFVWAEVEYAKDVDYQEEAMSYGYTDNGKFRHAYAGLPRLPENGYYRYRTNPKPDTVPWVITGAMKVNRLLSDAEVNAILEKNGVPPVHRQGGDVGLDKFGFRDDGTVKYSLSDDYAQIQQMQMEVNRLTNSIQDFEQSDIFKDQMRKISEAVDSGNVDDAIQDYQRYLKESGLEELTQKRNSLRDELEKLRKKTDEAIKNEALEEERIAIEKSGLSEADYFRKQAVKEFGYTPYFYDAGYIVSNGKMLNFSGEKGKHFGSRGQDHRAIGMIYEGTNGTAALNRFVNDGNIRIVPESPGFDVSATTEPTKEQYATIRKFIYQYADKGYFSIDISDKDGRVVGSLQYENRINPTRIIADLKHYYATGEVRQPSALEGFRYSLSEDNEGRQLSPATAKRFSNSKAVDENGNLLVLYHGTASGEFNIFDKSKGNVEGDFGSGFYFTNDDYDVDENYADGGPDFDNKVARLAEQIEQEEEIDYEEAEERARAELYKGGHTFEVYLNIENPAVVGKTILFDSEFSDRYNEEDFDDYDEYIAENEQAVADAIENIVWEVDRNVDVYSTDGLADVLFEACFDGGIGIEELKKKINELYLEDSNGNLVGNEVTRQIIESLGYDGIIDPTVSKKFNMGLDDRTTHYIVFKPNQIKAVTNQNPTDNPDIHRSLSAEGKNPKTYSKDVALSDALLQEEVAPVAENATTTPTVSETETVPDVAISETETTTEEPIVPVAEESSVAEMFPDDLAPIESELDKLYQQKEVLENRMTEAIHSEDMEAFTQANTEYDSTMSRIEELENEISETESARVGSLDDADAPPEVEAPYPGEPSEPADPFAERDMIEVGKRSVKAYQFENPEVKPFFLDAAYGMLDDIRRGTKGEKIFNGDVYYQSGGEQGWMGTKRQTTDDIADLLDNWHYTYAEIEEGLLNIIEDNGKENNAVSKRIEFMLDYRLRNGYTDVWGEPIPANQGYINLLREKQITEYSKESFERFMATADQYAPPAQEEDIAPVVKKPGKVSTSSEQMKLPLYHDPNNVSPAMDEVQADGDIAPVFETESGQQTIFPEAVTSENAASTRKALHARIIDNIKSKFAENGFDLDSVLKKAKNLSTFATVDNIPQRVMEKALGYKEGGILSDITVNKVAQNETEGIKWLNSFTDRKKGLLAQISKQYSIKPRSKESAAAQMYAEGFYVNENNEIISYGDKELAADFPDVVKQAQIKGLARDKRIRQIYDDTLKAINESRTRNAYPEIQRLDNYFLHFRAMNDTFSRLGLPFNPNDIRAKDLPTDLNGVTADLKPGQPYFASAQHRTGKRTDFDLLGGLEQYLTSAKNQIYHIDDIQTLRALRNYIADTYGQANGLEGLDALSEEEQQQRIEQVYGSHLSTFAKFLNEEANVLAGKTALIDRGLEGIIGRRGMTFLDTLNRQVGANMVGYNVSSSLTNFLAPVQAFAKSNKAAFIKGMAQFASNKVNSIYGKGDGFAEQSPVMIRRKGAERFHRNFWQKMSDPGYALMGAVDEISTELIARAKYNEFVSKGMDSQQAHIETDKWVSRLMGDRSLGQQPQLYNSKMLGIITKFQLEVRNQLDSQFYDTIQEAKVSNENIQNGLLKNAKTAAKVTSTFFQLAVAQHLFGKAFESVAGYNPAFDIISAIIKTFGWDDDEEDEDTVLDNIEQGFFELMGDMPYVSTLTGGRVPIASALPIEELYKGEDQYGNEKSRWETLGEAAPYYLLPGGYGQIKKTVAGLNMFSDEHPIAGSYTDSGNLRFPVEDNLGSRAQAAIFGQYASQNARDYFDNERSALKPKQIQEFIDVGMTIQDYWKYRDGLKDLSKLEEKINYINGLNLTTAQKNVLVNNLTDRKEAIDMADYDEFGSLEEFDYANRNPEKYAFFEEIGITYDTYRNADDDTKGAYDWAFNNPDKYTVSKAISDDYLTYYQYKKDLSEFDAKDENGETVSGLKKERVLNYINGLDMDYGQRIILYRSMYNSQADRDAYNQDIVDYLNSREDISYDEMITILKELDFTIGSDGVTIYWD